MPVYSNPAPRTNAFAAGAPKPIPTNPSPRASQVLGQQIAARAAAGPPVATATPVAVGQPRTPVVTGTPKPLPGGGTATPIAVGRTRTPVAIGQTRAIQGRPRGLGAGFK
jgi:hypothetical protein